MRASADAVVVGAGALGSAIALELSREGRSVIVVDKGGGAGLGSTSASSAIVRFNYSTEAGVAAAWESRELWENWEEHLAYRDEAGMARLVRAGMVTLADPSEEALSVTALFDEIGVPYEKWEPDGLESHLPGIDTGRYGPPKRLDDPFFFDPPEGDVGGLFTPDAGYVDDPQLAAHNLMSAAIANGAEAMYGQMTVEVQRRNERASGVVLADGTLIEAPVVVNAAGPWSGTLNALAGVGHDFNVHVRPLRQEVHQVPAFSGYANSSSPGLVVADLDLAFYMRPASGDHLLIGGLEPRCDPLEWLDDPDVCLPQVTSELFSSQAMRAARRFPSLRVPVMPSGIAGVYDVSDDWTPIYDRTELEGYYVAMGTSGNQFKNAPLVGLLMAALISETEKGRDHDSDPVRFDCRHIGRFIDLGAFSRLRDLNCAAHNVMG